MFPSLNILEVIDRGSALTFRIVTYSLPTIHTVPPAGCASGRLRQRQRLRIASGRLTPTEQAIRPPAKAERYWLIPSTLYPLS